MHFAKKIEKEVKSMKISKVVTMKNLDTSKNEEVKLDTKEIREFNFPKKDYIINKVFIDNLWLKIILLVWFLVLSALLVLAKISQSYGFLSILILISLITITIVANFQIARLYFFSEEENRNIEKRLLIRWAWAPDKEVKLPEKYMESEEKVYDFVKKACKEINKFAIRFYLVHLIVILALLFIMVLLIIENQPADKRLLAFTIGIWVLMEFYLWVVRSFIRAKARMLYNIAPRIDNGNNALEFSLNGNYIIEEEVELSKCIKVPSC